jgi:4-hydroxy-tetrahydrodipicolinate synthase
VRLTRHAVEHGAGGVLMLPPFYYKGVTDEGIFRAVAESIERVGDERLQVYLYHIPPMAVTGFTLSLIERLINAYPETVVGIKDSSGDLNNLQAILDAFPGFGTFAGTEKFLLQTLRSGGAGTITAMANIIPAEIAYLYDNWESPEADAIQADLNALREATVGLQPICALKEIVAAWRGDSEWRRVRPPLAPLSMEKAEALLSNPAVLARIAQPA